MSWDNTPITYGDVIQWRDDFQNAKDVIDRMFEDRTMVDREYLKKRMNDALFLVAFVESLLCIEVEDGVYDRARELQRGTKGEE